jgi:hypothetical protein
MPFGRAGNALLEAALLYRKFVSAGVKERVKRFVRHCVAGSQTAASWACRRIVHSDLFKKSELVEEWYCAVAFA